MRRTGCGERSAGALAGLLLLSGHSFGVAAGVALMRTTAPGRYAIILILPEPGSGFQA